MNRHTGSISLMPHAGKSFAGSARSGLFNLLSDSLPSKVFYIAANHANIAIDNYAALVLYTRNAKVPHTIFAKSPSQESSFEYVRDELHQHFGTVNIPLVAIMPTNYWNSAAFIDYLYQEYQQGACIIFGADFIHYGSQYEWTNLAAPVQLSKQILEAPLLEALCAGDQSGVATELAREPRLTCSPFVLGTLAHLVNQAGLRGRVIDYYDSYGSQFKGFARYAPHPEVKSFVSYATLYFAPMGMNPTRAETMTALAAIFTTVAYGIGVIPEWSLFSKVSNGVFVGSSLNGQHNCSYGAYETRGRTSAQNILTAARGCLHDAADRWRKPYPRSPLALMKYRWKLELLAPHSDWSRPLNTSEVLPSLSITKPIGILLTTTTGARATYLPGVWQESMANMSATQMLDTLAQKAGSGSSTGPGATLELYTSTVYYS